MSGLPPTPAVADVLALGGATGWLSPPLRRYADGAAADARAMTVQLADGPGDFSLLYELLGTDLAGAALVVAGGADVEGGVWGEILGTAASAAATVLIDGFVRDVADLPPLPLWARGEVTVGPAGRLHVSAVQVPVVVAGVPVEPGDRVLVDGAGVVALPAAVAGEVVDRACAYAAGEEAVLAAMRAGAGLAEAYRHKAAVVDDLRRRVPYRHVNDT